jgi:hypothetical protein
LKEKAMISFKRQRHWQANKWWRSRFLVLLFGLLTAGCGDSYGEISGKIYYKGQPLTAPRAIVTFMDANGGAFSSTIASDGKYAIAKVPVGQVKIAIVVLPPRRTDVVRQKAHEAVKSGKIKIPPEELAKMAPSSPPRRQARRLPPLYADPQTSGLMHTVTGGKQTHDIELW